MRFNGLRVILAASLFLLAMPLVGCGGRGGRAVDENRGTPDGNGGGNSTPPPLFQIRCEICNGRGAVDCNSCKGAKGDFVQTKQGRVLQPCAFCDGTGKELCLTCFGYGR